MADDFNSQPFIVIAAVDKLGGYAKNGEIPWHFKEDFTWFKERTMGHACVMGRNTYEDINRRLGEKAKDSVLPGRDCYVVSSTLESLPNATAVRSISEVALKVPNDYVKPIFIIGGEKLFIEGVSLAHTIYLTVINEDYGCDRWFPTQFVMRNFVVTQLHSVETCDKIRFVVWGRNPIFRQI